MQRILFITGTDTGVGKTLLTALLAAHLVREGRPVVALKPISSGPRDDARLLRLALGNSLTLATINPWHFRAPIAPLLAARAQKRTVGLPEVVSHIRAVANSVPQPEFVLVEGAGGLLSPLGKGFSSRDLITALRAEAVIVGENRLGLLNQILLTLEALPASGTKQARLVLMTAAKPDRASRTNMSWLTELTGGKRAALLPRFKDPEDFKGMLARPRIRQALDRLLN